MEETASDPAAQLLHGDVANMAEPKPPGDSAGARVPRPARGSGKQPRGGSSPALTGCGPEDHLCRKLSGDTYHVRRANAPGSLLQRPKGTSEFKEASGASVKNQKQGGFPWTRDRMAPHTSHVVDMNTKQPGGGRSGPCPPLPGQGHCAPFLSCSRRCGTVLEETLL